MTDGSASSSGSSTTAIVISSGIRIAESAKPHTTNPDVWALFPLDDGSAGRGSMERCHVPARTHRAAFGQANRAGLKSSARRQGPGPRDCRYVDQSGESSPFPSSCLTRLIRRMTPTRRRARSWLMESASGLSKPGLHGAPPSCCFTAGVLRRTTSAACCRSLARSGFHAIAPDLRGTAGASEPSRRLVRFHLTRWRVGDEAPRPTRRRPLRARWPVDRWRDRARCGGTDA